MGRSQSLRADHVLWVHQLCEDLVDLRAQPAALDKRMLEALCDYTGAARGASFVWGGFEPSRGQFDLQRATQVRWDGSDATRFSRFVAAGDFREDAIINAAAQISDPLVTCARCHVIPSQYEWDKAKEGGHARGVGTVNDLVGCFFRHSESDRVTALALHRLDNDRPFSQRDFAVLQAFNLCLAEQYRRGRFGLVMDSPYDLTPTEQELCSLLLRGESPSRIALDRHRSLATVQTQIKTIYRKLKVSSLNELIQWFSQAP